LATKIVIVEGTLDRRFQPQCRVRIVKKPIVEGGHLRYVYKNVSVIESDDFPIAVYTLSFQDHTGRRKRTVEGKLRVGFSNEIDSGNKDDLSISFSPGTGHLSTPGQ
jgi:hypothetical protein